MMVWIFLAAFVGFSLTLVLSPVAQHVARRFGVVAEPAADRWHRRQVPLLGGVAIALSVVCGAALFVPTAAELWILIGGALALFGVGLYDDLRPLKPQSKFVAQIVVATLLPALGLQLHLTNDAGVNLFLSIIWFVAISNAFNLLDNMDGLAAGVAAIAAVFRLGFFVADGNIEAAMLTALLAGSLLGFLRHNFKPASIFMGDAGSLFVGVMIAGLNMVGSWAYSRGTASVLLFPVLVLLVPIFDTVFVMIARTLAGRSIAMGGRDHPSHRLVALGLSEREAVIVLYVVAALAGAVATLSYVYQLSYVVVLVALLVIGLVLFGVYLARIQVYAEEEVNLAEGARFVTLVANFAYKRQVATVVIDLALIVLAYYCAYLLRYEAALHRWQDQFFRSLPLVIACQLVAFGAFRVYQGVWRYTSLNDLIRLAKAATVGTIASLLLLLATTGLAGYSRAVFVLDWLLLVVLVSGSRLSFRALAETLRPRSAELRRVVIYGAGDGGVMVLREVRNNLALQRQIVGFIDDDRSKHRTTVQGIPVLGGLVELEETIRTTGVDEVIVSSEKVTADRLTELSSVCQSLEVAVMRASLRLE